MGSLLHIVSMPYRSSLFFLKMGKGRGKYGEKGEKAVSAMVSFASALGKF